MHCVPLHLYFYSKTGSFVNNYTNWIWLCFVRIFFSFEILFYKGLKWRSRRGQCQKQLVASALIKKINSISILIKIYKKNMRNEGFFNFLKRRIIGRHQKRSYIYLFTYVFGEVKWKGDNKFFVLLFSTEINWTNYFYLLAKTLTRLPLMLGTRV